MRGLTWEGPIPITSALASEPGHRDYRHCVVAKVPPSTAADATAWAERIFREPPPALRGLVLARDRAVRPFGLRPVVGPAGDDRVGPFPLLRHTPDEVVFGMTDRHLDFRGSVCLTDSDAGRIVALAVVVQTHGAAGRAYLAGVRRVHPVLAAGLLRRAVRAAEPTPTQQPQNLPTDLDEEHS